LAALYSIELGNKYMREQTGVSTGFFERFLPIAITATFALGCTILNGGKVLSILTGAGDIVPTLSLALVGGALTVTMTYIIFRASGAPENMAKVGKKLDHVLCCRDRDSLQIGAHSLQDLESNQEELNSHQSVKARQIGSDPAMSTTAKLFSGAILALPALGVTVFHSIAYYREIIIICDRVNASGKFDIPQTLIMVLAYAMGSCEAVTGSSVNLSFTFKALNYLGVRIDNHLQKLRIQKSRVNLPHEQKSSLLSKADSLLEKQGGNELSADFSPQDEDRIALEM
jgi:hypothetical protein